MYNIWDLCLWFYTVKKKPIPLLAYNQHIDRGLTLRKICLTPCKYHSMLGSLLVDLPVPGYSLSARQCTVELFACISPHTTLATLLDCCTDNTDNRVYSLAIVLFIYLFIREKNPP